MKDISDEDAERIIRILTAALTYESKEERPSRRVERVRNILFEELDTDEDVR